MKRWLSLLLLFPTLATAQLKTVDSQYFSNVNILKNPGFENGLTQWVASAGTFALVTSTNVGFGFASASWTPSAISQTLKSNLAAIPQVMQGSTSCAVSFFYKGSDSNLNYKVVDQTNSTIAGPTTLSTAASWTQQTINFTCPSSGSLRVVFTSTASSAIIYLDQFQLGFSPILGLIPNSNLAQMPTNTIKGNNTGLSANPLDLTVAQTNTLLGDLLASGSVPLTGNWSAGSFSATFNSVIVGSAANRISGLSTIINSGTLTLPSSTDTLVGRATTDTLTNKTLSGNTAATLINGSGTLNLNSSGTVTLPNATDTLVGKATTDTLTNKTLTTPTIASIVSGSATSTLSTLSTGTGTLMPSTNWVSYTPTVVGLGTVSNVSVFSRREGDSVHVRGSLTCGTTTAVATTISLPSGANTIDTAKIPGDQTAFLGTFYRAAGGGSIPSTSFGAFAITAVVGTSTSVVFLSITVNSATPGFQTALGTAIGNSTDRIMFEFSVPVTQYAY